MDHQKKISLNHVQEKGRFFEVLAAKQADKSETGFSDMNLKEIFGKRYRVTFDESYKVDTDPGKSMRQWRYHEIRGKHGFVNVHGLDKPAVYFISNTVANRFRNWPGWKAIQEGDDERTVLFPKDDIIMVLEAIRARKRRQMTVENAEKARNRLAKWRLEHGKTIDEIHSRDQG